MEIGELGVAAAQFLVQLRAGRGGAGHQADDLEAGQLMVGERVGAAHVAGTDAKDPDGVGHEGSELSRWLGP